MKRVLFGSIAAAALLLQACANYKTIEPGHVGIKVEQTGSQRGVQDFPIQTGRVWYNPWNEYVLDYPTHIIQYTWTRDTNEGHPQNEEMCFKSSDYLLFCADVNAAFNVVDERAPYFYVKFRSDDIDVFTHGFLRNIIRDSFTRTASQYSADDLNGPKQSEMLTKVFEASKAQLYVYGVNLETLGFAHPPRPPAEMQQAITAKLTAVQNALKVENEVMTSKAEADKQIAEAKGKAESNRIEMQSITPQLIQMRMLEKWDGVLPQVQGGGTPLITLPQPQK